ncbi:DUF3967 domain-containing protein [Sporosarcina sp. OR05]|uniref:DUF3967 domain-containing protein n=1 Tax=Sporosarcina sp. OR05 TaxID=2969819 RepID=UPI00352A89FA
MNVKTDMKIYSSKEVAERLKLQPVTVRKYSQMLEEQGYSFTKDDKGWRLYSEDDITSLQYLSNMRAAGKTLHESVDYVATLYRSNLSLSQSAISLQESNPMMEFMKAQQEFNQKILERLEASEKRQMERDQNLLKAIRETQEVKKLILSKKKRWWEFWK